MEELVPELIEMLNNEPKYLPDPKIQDKEFQVKWRRRII
jgi:hypothetical protein